MLEMQAEQKNAKAETEAKLREKIASLEQQLVRSREANVCAAQAATAKIVSLNDKLLEQRAKNLTLNADIKLLKAQGLEDKRVIQSQVENIRGLEMRSAETPELKVAIARMTGEIAELNSEVARQKDRITMFLGTERIMKQTLKEVKERAARFAGLEREKLRLQLRSKWAIAKARLAAFEEFKQGIPDLDAVIVRAEADVATAQGILDSVGLSPEDSDEEEEVEEDGDGEQDAGEIGEPLEVNTTTVTGEGSAEDKNRAEEGNP